MECLTEMKKENRKGKILNSMVSKVEDVEGDTKDPFSIATTPSCREGYYSIPWIAPLYP